VSEVRVDLERESATVSVARGACVSQDRLVSAVERTIVLRPVRRLLARLRSRQG